MKRPTLRVVNALVSVTPKPLIITPTLGSSPWIEEMLTSVAALEIPVQHKLIAPQCTVPSLVAVAPGREIIHDNGTGIYTALNHGLAAPLDWELFTWLNDDDLLVSPGFGNALAAFARQAEADVAFGRVSLIDGAGQRIGELPVARRGADVAALLARGIVPFAQPGTIIRRRIWDRLGGFDASYRNAGDLDFFVRALAAGARFMFVDAEVAAFRLSAGQLSKRRDEVEAETVRALRPLATQPASVAAWCRFRAGNLGVYFERIRRHGWVSMREIYDRTK